MKRLTSFIVLLTGLAIPMSSCGGGGGGGGFSGAAFVRIDAEPRTIDVGDQLTLKIEISDVHENGIALKIKYPSDLAYVNNSARLEVDGDEVDLAPAVNAASSDDIFLVFFLSQDTFGSEDASGELFIELEGAAENEEAKIEVDADVDDPDLANPGEFDIENPEFSAEDEITIFVDG